MTDDERTCFNCAMEQWYRSLRRPDMNEEDRIKGAILAYMRQAFALRITPEPSARLNQILDSLLPDSRK